MITPTTIFHISINQFHGSRCGWMESTYFLFYMRNVLRQGVTTVQSQISLKSWWKLGPRAWMPIFVSTYINKLLGMIYIHLFPGNCNVIDQLRNFHSGALWWIPCCMEWSILYLCMMTFCIPRTIHFLLSRENCITRRPTTGSLYVCTTDHGIINPPPHHVTSWSNIILSILPDTAGAGVRSGSGYVHNYITAIR